MKKENKSKKGCRVPKTTIFENVLVTLRFDHPSALKDSDTPCRCRVNLINPITGKLYTKREVYGTDSDYLVDYVVYGVDESDIWNNKIEDAASKLIVHMKKQGLINPPSETNDTVSHLDLGVIAKEVQESFFDRYKGSWQLSTINDYRYQYSILAKELEGVNANTLNDIEYNNLQIRICNNAAAKGRKSSGWRSGEKPPPSAGKRLWLLYLLIRHLEEVEGIPIPVSPSKYKGKIPRDEQLMNRIDGVRSLPFQRMSEVCPMDSPMWELIAIIADAGCRISEAFGLLFCSVQSIETSQGTMYYIVITGQLDSSGKRTEITKTDASYRTIPLS